MELKNIETADCLVESTSFIENELRIKFETIYDLDRKEFIKDVELVIYNWSAFDAKIYIANAAEEPFIGKNLSTDDMEFFDLVQTINNEGDNLLLQGFSRGSGNWLEYHFDKCDFYFEKCADA